MESSIRIITCAVTGGIHTPSMSEYLPVTAEEIAEAAIGAAEAGAAIVHLHTRNPADGRPSQDPDFYAPILQMVKAHSDVIVNLTTGGAPSMTLEERLRPVTEFQPELASLNMGSMNFGLFPLLGRYKEFEHDWEEPHLSNSRDWVFKNTFADIERILDLGKASGTRFEYECYDSSHLENLAFFRNQGLTEGPLFVQSVFGILGGIGAHFEDLVHMRRTAERLLGDGYEWSLFGTGKNQMRMAGIGAAVGSHVRVGLEDSLWIGRGQLAQSNAEQVSRAKTVLESLDFKVATPDEARAMLKLKGVDNVGF
ncbi:3-keto-5-aminohexanoate cleavage protein [Rhodococcus erythropolis]|uniref:3-keto-5-aminohexanoate cleavage protein n=1 Tax=Rhodococcus erythropolis TaxID=1833 RepID=UPI0008784D09|nr:3-keto-5-aminohexanoate cleavage protein [Rhodococcus erythropolis]OFV76443.1 3-keto-5-aminohexanoate cleavage enzyme [Rhodococcus erythropolis]